MIDKQFSCSHLQMTLQYSPSERTLAMAILIIIGGGPLLQQTGNHIRMAVSGRPMQSGPIFQSLSGRKTRPTCNKQFDQVSLTGFGDPN